MQDGYENIMFDIIQRDRETIAEHSEVGYRLRETRLTNKDFTIKNVH